tara:strand:- start:25 stop:321 length:297 start_codon:yes stop_codon:yes gene_type:complete
MRYGKKYKSYPYTVPINHKALQHTKIKELQVRMMRWAAYVKDHKPTKNGIGSIVLHKNKWQDRFTFSLRCQKRAGKLTKGELEQLNDYWKIYDENRLT